MSIRAFRFRITLPALAGLLFGALPLERCSATPPPTRIARPVILLMLDTLRADHLGFYGYERDTSPNLDAFARESIAFKYAFTAAPWTPPSVATMLTGLYPSSHGHQPPDASEDALSNMRRLSSELVTLPEILRPLGYATAAVSPNPWISAPFGFDQGFDTFEYRPKAPAAVIASAGIALIDGFVRRGRPFLLYLHFFDPHDPYSPPERYAEMFPAHLTRTKHPYGKEMLRLMGRYDGEIRYLDDELGRVFAHLKSSGLYQRALIVVIADHGEQFKEHGRKQHGNALHNEEIHVPFLVRDPLCGRPAGVDERVVSTVDLFPTILGQLGIPPPPGQADGLSVFADERIAARRSVLSEIRRITDQRALIGRDKQKAIFSVPLEGGATLEQRAEVWRHPQLVGVYDIQDDYFEQDPGSDAETPVRLRAELERGFGRLMTQRRPDTLIPAAAMSRELTEQLRTLGYLGGN